LWFWKVCSSSKLFAAFAFVVLLVLWLNRRHRLARTREVVSELPRRRIEIREVACVEEPRARLDDFRGPAVGLQFRLGGDDELRHVQAVRLRAHRVDLAVHLLEQKVELPSARLRAVGQRRPVRHVGTKPRDLLADVGTRGHPDDLLCDRRLVSLEIGPQLADAVGDPLLHRRATLVGGGGDALDQIRDERAPLVQVGAQMVPFERAHRVERGEPLRHDVTRLCRQRVLPRVVVGRLSIADGDRLRKTQQIPWRQRAAHEAHLARAIER